MNDHRFNFNEQHVVSRGYLPSFSVGGVRRHPRSIGVIICFGFIILTVGFLAIQYTLDPRVATRTQTSRSSWQTRRWCLLRNCILCSVKGRISPKLIGFDELFQNKGVFSRDITTRPSLIMNGVKTKQCSSNQTASNEGITDRMNHIRSIQLECRHFEKQSVFQE